MVLIIQVLLSIIYSVSRGSINLDVNRPQPSKENVFLIASTLYWIVETTLISYYHKIWQFRKFAFF